MRTAFLNAKIAKDFITKILIELKKRNKFVSVLRKSTTVWNMKWALLFMNPLLSAKDAKKDILLTLLDLIARKEPSK